VGIPLRVLIVEDSEDDVLLLLRELRRGGYDPTHVRVDTRDAMRAALDRQAWDSILCDYAMPHFSAPKALSLLQETRLDLPFIIVSGTIGEDVAVTAMKAGAHDYLLKGNLTRLAPAIERELREAKERAARRQAEDALRETAETLRAIIEASPLAIIALEPEGTVRLWNPAAERIFGWSAAEVLGGPLPFVPADRQEESQALRQRVLQGEAISGVEIRRKRKDGSPIDVSLSTAPLHDSHGRVTGIVGIVADISERRRAEQRLHLQGAALEAAANAIVITDREGRITWVNPAFTRLTGYTPEEILGENLPATGSLPLRAACRSFSLFA
jgi:PAS domain S-box-containing protein